MRNRIRYIFFFTDMFQLIANGRRVNNAALGYIPSSTGLSSFLIWTSLWHSLLIYIHLQRMWNGVKHTFYIVNTLHLMGGNRRVSEAAANIMTPGQINGCNAIRRKIFAWGDWIILTRWYTLRYVLSLNTLEWRCSFVVCMRRILMVVLYWNEFVS